jgi:hypothetical protein
MLHFAVVRAVVEYQGARMLASQQAAGIDSLNSIKRWRDQLVANQDESLTGCPLGTLGSELAETDPPGRQIAAAEFERWRDSIRDGLDEMCKRGELADGVDTNDLATALLAALQGGLLLSHITQSSQPLEKALDAMITLIETNARG